MDNIEQLTRLSEEKLRSKNLSSLLHLPYEKKVSKSKATVQEFINILGEENCYVSTSGGKDSSVLSQICKEVFPEIQHYMFNTGLEYLATIDLAKSQGAKVIPPKISWEDSCEIHGYPIVSKNISRRLGDIGKTPISTCIALFNPVYGISNKWLHLTDKQFVDFKVSGYCCVEFKKRPSSALRLNPIIGTRVTESSNRRSAWKKSGCNSYSADYKNGVSRPISLWVDEDIERFINDNKVVLSIIYTQYEQKRTGCKICPYGSQIDGSRFELLKKLEPKTYDKFIYKTKLGYILKLMNVNIDSDPLYMKQKEELQEKIEKWRIKNMGRDKYLSYKVELALKYFTVDEIKKALDHLKSKESLSRYDEIMQLLDQHSS